MTALVVGADGWLRGDGHGLRDVAPGDAPGALASRLHGGACRSEPDARHGGLRQLRSPNFDARPPGIAVELLVIHNISLPPGEFGGGHVARLFTSTLDPAAHPFFSQIAGSRVSAHFLVERDGGITQFVSCADRAWHAGASSFRGRTRCNDFSIGIELEGTDFAPFTDAQYGALDALVPALAAAYPLAAARGHSEIAVDRKTDPGPLFDWRRCAPLAALAAR